MGRGLGVAAGRGIRGKGPGWQVSGRLEGELTHPAPLAWKCLRYRSCSYGGWKVYLDHPLGRPQGQALVTTQATNCLHQRVTW